MLRTRIEIQDHALNIIYNEIHENIGQMLSSVHMRLLTISAGDDAGPAYQHLSDLAGYMGHSIRDLRNLGHALNGIDIDKTGLVDALEKEIIFASSVYNLQCIFTNRDELPQLGQTRDITLFRIMQGMIGYMFAHCRNSQSVWFQLQYDDDTLTASITDPYAANIDEIRLKKELPASILERIQLMRGEIAVTNLPEKGTVLFFTCKLNHGHHI